MAKLEMITIDDVKELRVAIDAALECVAEEYGMRIKLGNIRFDASGFKGQIEASIMNDGGVPQMVLDELARASTKFGLPSDLYGRAFTSNGRKFKIVGAKLSRRKYPFIGEGPQGGRYKFPVNAIKNNLID